jgi:NTP pyrophosphatase (non-canonical NTP hydrolase)
MKRGDIVRYDTGETALAMLVCPHAGGWHARQFFGGFIFISDHIFFKLKLATVDEVKYWYEEWRAREIDRPWRDRVLDLHEALMRNTHEPYSPEDQRFLALGFGGEVGETLNLIKKEWRDGANLKRQTEIRKELADCQLYLTMLARAFNCNLDHECSQKLDELQEKWKDKLEASHPVR